MRAPLTIPHSGAFGKREQSVRLAPVCFRLQEFAALTVFCNYDPHSPFLAGRPERPSPIFDCRNRLVLGQFPSRPVRVDSADMMNSVVLAGSVGFVDTMDLNLA